MNEYQEHVLRIMADPANHIASLSAKDRQAVRAALDAVGRLMAEVDRLRAERDGWRSRYWGEKRAEYRREGYADEAASVQADAWCAQVARLMRDADAPAPEEP